MSGVQNSVALDRHQRALTRRFLSCVHLRDAKGLNMKNEMTDAPLSSSNPSMMSRRVVANAIPILCTGAALGIAGTMAMTVPAYSQATSLIVDVTIVGKGYRVSKLMGKAVYNSTNEKIGEVDDFVIGLDRVLFTILQVGGFLGVGGRLVAVPYAALMLNADGTRITLPGATKEQLLKLKPFAYLV
jgi:hypothetical protein